MERNCTILKVCGYQSGHWKVRVAYKTRVRNIESHGIHYAKLNYTTAFVEGGVRPKQGQVIQVDVLEDWELRDWTAPEYACHAHVG